MELKGLVKYAIDHINGPYQQTSLGLLPYVLKRGDIIGEHDSHKMRGKHTITIGAPVEINGTRGNMGVVVNMNGKHAYSARVLLPDGSAFVFSEDMKKTSQGMHQGVLKNESLADTTSEVSNIRIAHPEANVKRKFSTFEENDKKITEAPVTMANQEGSQRRQDASAYPILPQSEENVNSKLSTSEENEDDIKRFTCSNLSTNLNRCERRGNATTKIRKTFELKGLVKYSAYAECEIIHSVNCEILLPLVAM